MFAGDAFYETCLPVFNFIINNHEAYKALGQIWTSLKDVLAKFYPQLKYLIRKIFIPPHTLYLLSVGTNKFPAFTS